MRNRIIKLPVITFMMMVGAGLAVIIFAVVIIGVFAGFVKELFYYIGSSQGFSTKSAAFNTDSVNVLITQD